MFLHKMNLRRNKFKNNAKKYHKVLAIKKISSTFAARFSVYAIVC